MYFPLELELLQLTQFSPPAITSGASDAADGWQCDPWFKTGKSHHLEACCIECDGLAAEIS